MNIVTTVTPSALRSNFNIVINHGGRCFDQEIHPGSANTDASVGLPPGFQPLCRHLRNQISLARKIRVSKIAYVY